ncbi:nucleobindin-2 isoform X5 [Hydra vulgaris]|uniref:Nucleobindin-2 isoform X5 n=1 Tax=Hydra vulgaris TaxID=6087 RepID=A0ABM4BFR8_HYDVU
MKELLTFGIFLALISLHVAPPVGKKEPELPANETGTVEDKQDAEYFRYLSQVVEVLEKDPEFKSKLHNASEEDIRTGKIANYLDLVGHGVRLKLDEIKRTEVEYQRELLRQRQDFMSGIERNYWNPIHHDNKDSFEMEDLKKLLSKHNDMMSAQDAKRHEEFKAYEMEKEHERREKLHNMTAEERAKEEASYKEHREQRSKHEKIHEPGHKAQLEETWEKEDGLDPENFDARTFFNLHDKNGDSFLDMYEIETVFLADIDKVYNESNPEVDLRERSEEIERMREHVMKNMDKDKDGLISFTEFMDETKSEDFEKDEDWKPLTEQDQFTEEELQEYEKMLSENPHGENVKQEASPKVENH